VVPLPLDFARYRQPPNPVLVRLLHDGLVNLLFVGRVSPNKCHADLIRVVAYWKRCIGRMCACCSSASCRDGAPTSTPCSGCSTRTP